MGQNKRKKHKTAENANRKSESDSCDSLIEKIARDSLLDSDGAGPVAVLPKKGDIIDGKYEIDEKLGSGGMGAVYSATQLNMNRRVAIKVMQPRQSLKKERVQRFRREAQVTGRLRHRNVVRIHDTGEHKGAPYLVMELLNGEPLSALIKTGNVFPYRDAIALLMPVMRGVAAVHDAGVVHRDLKPGNILLCQGDHKDQREPVVLDFGVSKLLEQHDQADASLTTENTFLGTPYYSALEQLETNKRVDCRADVYSLGVILYELLTGRLPFYAKCHNEIVIKIATTLPKPPFELRPEIPEKLSDVVMKAISRNPDDRFRSVKEFALALEPFADRVSFSSDETITIVRSAPFSVGLTNRFAKSRLAQLSALALFLVLTAWIVASALPASREIQSPRPAKTETYKTNSEIQRASVSTVRIANTRKAPRKFETEKRTEMITGEARMTNQTKRAPTRQPRYLVSQTNKARPITSKATQKSTMKKRMPLDKTVPTREVTFVNSLRASVKVELKCPPDFRKEVFIPAMAQEVASVPQQDCLVVCIGRGDPFCYFKLYSDRDSFRISR